VSDESTVLRTDAERIFLAALPWIDRAAATLAARYGLDPDEKDDFTSAVHEKLIEDDYAAIRKHRGEASLQTYLTTVIANHYKDRCVQRWGRWRPSAVARREGTVAIRLEALIHRDGHTLDQALAVVRSEGVTLDTSELRRMALLSPLRANPRKHESRIPADARAPDRAEDGIENNERDRAHEGALAVLRSALEQLPARDQVLLRLHIWEGMTVADIARGLGEEQKGLYRRIERCHKKLRRNLEAAGLAAADVRDLLVED
jgi:RNA polymerase sigma factor (sigma-70 family)